MCIFFIRSIITKTIIYYLQNIYLYPTTTNQFYTIISNLIFIHYLLYNISYFNNYKFLSLFIIIFDFSTTRWRPTETILSDASHVKPLRAALTFHKEDTQCFARPPTRHWSRAIYRMTAQLRLLTAGARPFTTLIKSHLPDDRSTTTSHSRSPTVHATLIKSHF